MGANKKETILKATIRCIGKYGIEKTSAQTVADYLGVAQSGIFYYFPKQQMLFDALTQYIVEVNHGLVQEHTHKARTHYEKLILHLEGNLLWARKHPDQVGILLLSMVRAQSNRPMKLLINKVLQAGENRINECLSAAIANKELTVLGEVSDVSAFIHKALIGTIVSYYYSRSQQNSVAQYIRVLKINVDTLLNRTA